MPKYKYKNKQQHSEQYVTTRAQLSLYSKSWIFQHSQSNLKTNLMMMIETLKAEMKNSLKEIEEKPTKNWRKSINLLKNSK